jgi:hypothetical protein
MERDQGGRLERAPQSSVGVGPPTQRLIDKRILCDLLNIRKSDEFMRREVGHGGINPAHQGLGETKIKDKAS